jgi:hypothetical protein
MLNGSHETHKSRILKTRYDFGRQFRRWCRSISSGCSVHIRRYRRSSRLRHCEVPSCTFPVINEPTSVSRPSNWLQQTIYLRLNGLRGVCQELVNTMVAIMNYKRRKPGKCVEVAWDAWVMLARLLGKMLSRVA